MNGHSRRETQSILNADARSSATLIASASTESAGIAAANPMTKPYWMANAAIVSSKPYSSDGERWASAYTGRSPGLGECAVFSHISWPAAAKSSPFAAAVAFERSLAAVYLCCADVCGR